MKKQLLVIVGIMFFLGLSSCKKKDTPAPTPTPTTPQLYISFTLDGVSKNITNTTNQINTGYGGGAYTSSGFFTLTDEITMLLSMPQDSIVGADLQSLVGKKLTIGSCGGCPTNIYLSYNINGNDYESYDTNNPSPDDYIQFNTVTYDNTINLFGQNVKEYYVTGTFNLKLSYGSDIKNATNGKFTLIFQQSTM
jgi:hypothetical protein